MRAIISKYDCVSPKDLQSAIKALKSGATPIAGGTDLMVQFETGALPAGTYANLWNLDELRGIRQQKQCIEIGALTTYTDLRESELIQRYFPLLIQAAKVTGAFAIQNRGTIGGNIINASPAADTPPVLLVHEAKIELVSQSGSRWVEYNEFHLDYKKTLRRREELLTRIQIPIKQTKNAVYRKVGTRRAQAISKVCFVALRENESFRIAFGSVAPIPKRCLKTESFLKNNPRDAEGAKQVLAQEISPIDDIRSSGAYRLKVAQNLIEDYVRGQ